MKTKDSLTEHYNTLLEGEYDCIDRIVLNAYCTMLLVDLFLCTITHNNYFVNSQYIFVQFNIY